MKLIRKFGILLFLLTISTIGNSQSKLNKFGLTLDLFGNSGLFSLNGEYEVGKFKDYKLNARIGFGYYSGNSIQFTGIPIGINLLTGTKRHHFELGLGASYIKGAQNMHLPTGAFGNTQDFWFQSEGMYFVPSIGYRFDKLTGGLILKVYYSPLITVFDFFDKEKFLNELIPVLYGNWTKEEYYNHAFGNSNNYPTAKSQFGNFGISIGYRF